MDVDLLEQRHLATVLVREGTPEGTPSTAADGAGQPLILHEFQDE